MQVKKTALNYRSSKINLKQFFNRTNIDTMMKNAQTNTAVALLDTGNIRELANYIADTYTLDMFRGYNEEERAGIERKREPRTIIGIYTYIRGVYDSFVNRGFRHIIEGIRKGQFGRAKRGAMNIAKGVAGRGVANVILGARGFSSFYLLA